MDNMLALVTPQEESRLSLPVLVGREGESGRRRFLEFFTVNIRNANTRTAYTHAAEVFLAWCEARGITELRSIQPVHVAGYIEQLQKERVPRGRGAPKVGWGRVSSTSSPVSMAVRISAKCSCAYWALTFMGLG